MAQIPPLLYFPHPEKSPVCVTYIFSLQPAAQSWTIDKAKESVDYSVTDFMNDEKEKVANVALSSFSSLTFN